jgi:hypothetical protein
MWPLFKTIGAVGILSVCLAATAQLSAKTSDLPDRALCVNALNLERSAWSQNSVYSDDVAEAKRRGLTVVTCRQRIDNSNWSAGSTFACPPLLARPEVQKFAATALAATKQDLLRNVPMDELSAAMIEKFQLHMREMLSAHPHYSNATELNKVMKAIYEASSDGLRACFPQVSEFAAKLAEFEKDLNRRTTTQRPTVVYYEDMLRQPHRWTDCSGGRQFGAPREIPFIDLGKDIAEFGKQKVYSVAILAADW